MALMSLMQYAEGPKCRVDALLANDIQGLVGALAGAREVEQAKNEIIANPRELVDTVVARITKLLDKEPEEEENHPYDAAIAAYLFVLGRASARGIGEAFEILRNSERTDMPWTAMMCRWILARRGESSEAGSHQDEVLQHDLEMSDAVEENKYDTNSDSPYDFVESSIMGREA